MVIVFYLLDSAKKCSAQDQVDDSKMGNKNYREEAFMCKGWVTYTAGSGTSARSYLCNKCVNGNEYPQGGLSPTMTSPLCLLMSIARPVGR